MTRIALRFPGGRYHATPWGHHVNEAGVEWPPSPWRLLRALRSVGHTALHWDDGIPQAARGLLEALASEAPRYTLPPAGVAHTRHYLPLASLKEGREATSLVFDAFARPGGGELSIEWPAALGAEQRALLGELLRHLNYLGRSESWVEARLLESDEVLPEGAPCWPCALGPPRQATGWEQVPLLGPLSAGEYQAWRTIELRRAREALGATAPGGHRKRRGSRSKDIEVPYPEDLWACLAQATSDLREQGWSLPPGSQRVFYWRRRDALRVSAPASARRPVAQRPEAFLLSVALPGGNLHALPPVTRTLPQAELLHRAAVSLLARGAAVSTGMELIGRDLDGKPLGGHQHAHILPLDLDGDGHLEHILVWAPGGFGPEAQAALKGLRRTHAKGLAEDLFLAIASIGSVDALCTVQGKWGDGLRAALGPGTTWRSETPFLPPRFLKRRGRNTLEGQVRAELASRGLPAPVEVRALGRDETLQTGLRHFVRERARGGEPSKTRFWYGLELRFDEPVRGPLCLGYASHFGMGRFRTGPAVMGLTR